jgi:endonuclease/exonuclease/phosphatase family metal-dependent hydrolase
MKLATYNVENLFLRARALNLDTWSEGKTTLDMHKKLNALFAKKSYSAADKQQMLSLIAALGLDKADDSGGLALLRQSRGKLLKRPRKGPPEIVAEGRSSWVGWLDLVRDTVDEVATRATARVISDVGADVLAVVESESRPALKSFSDSLLPMVGGRPYDHVMLIEGNDRRGIDVGIMTRADYPITGMVSHVDDLDGKEPVFGRDCPVYTLHTPSGSTLHLLINHWKSKGYGKATEEKRMRQAKRVHEIYSALIASGADHVAVLGDLNDTPDSAPLQVLQGAGLRDVAEHPRFQADPARPGTYGNGTKSGKIDYILLSPKLFERVQDGAVFRKGVWAGAHGTIFEHYPEITNAGQAASDHAALWAELEL